MEKEKIKILADKVHRGTASKKEMAEFNYYYKYFQENTELNSGDLDDADRIEAELFSRIHDSITRPSRRSSRIWLPVAASLLVLFSLGIYIYSSSPTRESQPEHLASTDIAPATDKAVLILDDGSKIALTGMEEGHIIKQDGIRLTNENGILIYNAVAGALPGSNAINSSNTISIPRGGKYQVILPDGTKVWLNAASTLRYPTHFSSDERRVDLSGEAYFEVAQLKNHQGKNVPFIVSSRFQEVEVLGTHFNISDYPEEPSTKTTLLEGKIRVHVKVGNEGNGRSNSVTLAPNQQTTLSENGKLYTQKNIDPEQAVAWKSGLFVFNDEPLESIMRKIARWYDVDVVFTTGDPDRTVWGSVSRFKNVSEVLEKLEMTGSAHFDIEINQENERRIIVMK